MIRSCKGEACLLKSSPHSPRIGGGGDKLHLGGKDGSNNCIEKQLVLLELESMIQIWGGRATLGRVIIAG